MENKYPHQIYWLFFIFRSYRKYVIIFLAISVILTGGLWISSMVVEEEIDTQKSHSVIVSHSQEATITEDTRVYSIGETVSRTYPHRIVSDVDIRVNKNEQNVQIDDVRLSLVYEVSERQTGDVFISQTEPIISSGEERGSLDIEEMREQIRDYQQEFEQSVRVQVFVETTLLYSYESIDGQQFDGEVSERHSVGSEGTLTVIPLEDVTAQHTTGVRETQQPSSYIPTTAFVMTVLVLLYIFLYHQSKRLSAKKWKEIYEHNKYANWFTEIENSNISGNPSVNYVPTLSGLVNMAINSENPVVWDSTHNEYHLQLYNSVYVYGPDLQPNENPAFLMFGMGDEYQSFDDISKSTTDVFGGRRDVDNQFGFGDGVDSSLGEDEQNDEDGNNTSMD